MGHCHRMGTNSQPQQRSLALCSIFVVYDCVYTLVLPEVAEPQLRCVINWQHIRLAVCNE